MKIQDTLDLFPLSRLKKIKGTRRIVREKVLQILTAYKISGTSLDILFPHIFYRSFNFLDEDLPDENRLLTPDEIMEIESDIPIKWNEENIQFGTSLLRVCMEREEEFDSLVTEIVQNWEIDRLALIDRILIHMALAELLYFDEIPPKVSVNEMIDISKQFSTEKSGTFINGLLDSLLEILKKQGKIQKTGRGLIDQS
jgi:transcription antitermination protein NusB